MPSINSMTLMTRPDSNPAMIPSVDGADECADWKARLRNAWRDPVALLASLGLDSLVPHLDLNTPFAFLVTREFASRIRPGDPDDPLLRQVLPLASERQAAPHFVADPVGDRASRRMPGLLHKYRGRALLITTEACPIHCRYCFRRAHDYASDRLNDQALERIIGYLKADPGIEELILSGGDPLMLGNARLTRLTDALGAVPHLKRLRIHSRVPVTLPQRVDDGLCEWLGSVRYQTVVVIHANHAQEFDAQVARALHRLRQAGAWVLNQAVLLAGVNDDPETLAGLMTASFTHGALPYYLHLLDRVAGSRHFEVEAHRARSLAEQLRIRLPGYLVPRLVREQAGMPYKQPIL
ncbi:MAG: EF-P beta-lysylation protein EpmB [Wenzhouxiangellaceae bacterium]